MTIAKHLDERENMWPYMIRLNPVGLTLFVVVCIGIYFLYSSTVTSRVNLLKPLMVNDRRQRLGDDLMMDGNILIEDVNLKELLIAGIQAAEVGGHEVVKVRESTGGIKEKSKGQLMDGQVKDPVTEGDMKSHIAMVNGLIATFPQLSIISEEQHGEMDNDETFKKFHTSSHSIHDNDLNALPDINAPLGNLTVWIDPLDATHEYTEHLDTFVTTMVCVALNGKPIIGIIHKPFDKITYWGWAGVGLSNTVKSISMDKNDSAKNSSKIIVSRKHQGTVKEVAMLSLGPQTEIIEAGGAGYKAVELIKGNADVYLHVTLIKKWDICAPNALINAITGGKFTTLTGTNVNYTSDPDTKNYLGVIATIAKDHDNLLKKLSKTLVTSSPNS